jgi:hypothetical protein
VLLAPRLHLPRKEPVAFMAKGCHSSPRWQPFSLNRHKGRIAVLVTVKLASNIFNPRTHSFHRRDNFICWHIEAFGPVPQFVIFIWIDELALRCPPYLCHFICPLKVPQTGPCGGHPTAPSHTAMLESSGARN